MTTFSDCLIEQLNDSNLGPIDFQRVVMRLLANQGLYSDQSNAEREAYYQFLRMEDAIHNYLAILGFTIFHDKTHGYVIVFAPGAKSPVLQESDNEEYKGIKRSLTANDIALLIILRESYEQALRRGINIDENGCADISNEMINTSFNLTMGRPAPTGTQRSECFQTANSLRVISANLTDWSDSESWIKVRPVITSLVFSNLFSHVADQLLEEDEDGEEIDDMTTDNNLELLSGADDISLKNQPV